MSDTAYVLYVDDDVAGPALELLRRAIQPDSKSMPHVTVMYVRKELQDHGSRIYDRFVADQLTLVRPGTFDTAAHSNQGLRTLFLQCEALSWEYLHHKPDYPDSFLHVSLYDGRVRSTRASVALQILREFPWDLDISLPNLSLTTQRRRAVGPGNLSPRAASLLSRLSSFETDPEDLVDLSANELADLVRQIAAYLHSSLPSSPPRNHHQGNEYSVAESSIYRQEELWPAISFLDPRRADYSLLADKEANKRDAVFITPPELAVDICKAALSWVESPPGPVHFGDPAIGSGVFLAALVSVNGPNAIKSAIGVEADPVRAHLTHDRWRSVGLDLVSGDFVSGMCETAQDDFNYETGVNRPWQLDKRSLILANPPYIRSQRLRDDQVARWRRIIERDRNISIDSRSDLYVYFVLSAHEWLAEGGVAAWLLPTEFMFTNYGRSLREYLSTEVTLLAVHSYDGPSKFTNARVTSCAVIFRNTPPPHGSTVRFSAGGIISDAYVSRMVRQDSLQQTAKWHLIADEGLSTSTPPGQPTIGTLFDVRRGIATGANDYFVVSDVLARALGAPRDWLRPVLPRARKLLGPTVEATDDGDPIVPELRWLIDIDADWSEIDRRAPLLGNYLRSIEDTVKKRTLVRRRRTFYKQEGNRPAPFVFSYMARDETLGKRFFLNRSSAVVLNNYLALYPKPFFANWLNEERQRDKVVLELLRGIDTDEFSRAGRVYVEGLTKVEPRELAGITLRQIPPSLATLIPSGITSSLP